MSIDTVTICIPIYNEIEVIEKVLSEWSLIVGELPKGSKILIEDGGSSDGTVQVLRNYQKKFDFIDVLYRDKPDGFGNAAKRLLKLPTTEWVFFTDGDGQFVPSDIWKLWQRKEDYDLVKGIKLGRKDPLLRRIISFFWSSLIQVMFGLFITDINAGFLLMRNTTLKQVIEEVRFLDSLVISEIVIRLITNNCRKSDDIYVLHRAREGGKSRAIPNYKLPKLMYSHLRGLLLLKKDYRKNY
jgi:glycosyltransferase involved in cell wall biosynthesis